MVKNIRIGGMLYFEPLPKIEYMVNGIKPADQESKPWSNNSPKGPLVPVLRACFPSTPSEINIVPFQKVTTISKMKDILKKKCKIVMGYVNKIN